MLYSSDRKRLASLAASYGLLRVFLILPFQVMAARQHEQGWREQAATLQVSLENVRVDLQDITSNMQRQYKVLQ